MIPLHAYVVKNINKIKNKNPIINTSVHKTLPLQNMNLSNELASKICYKIAYKEHIRAIIEINIIIYLFISGVIGCYKHP